MRKKGNIWNAKQKGEIEVFMEIAVRPIMCFLDVDEIDLH